MPKSRAVEIERENKLARLEKHLVRGLTNQHELAAAFGVTQVTICKWIAIIRNRWANRSTTSIDQKRERRIQQMDYLGSLAIVEFEKSKKASEDFAIEVRPCSECHGTKEKKVNDHESIPCDYCNGKGTITVERITVKERNGDPAYIATARACFMDGAKLEGLVKEVSKAVSRTRYEEISNTDGEMKRKIEEIYYEVPVDVIIRAKATLDDLKRTSRKVIESEVVKSEVVEDENDDSSDAD